MIRFTWLQARAQTAVALAALAAAAILAAVTGPRLLHLYAVAAACPAGADCGAATTAFLSSYHWLQVAQPTVLLALPALLGAFWGAPLVARELETGTFRLAWTQSVTRQRWLAVKLALTGVAAMALTGLLSLIVTWWSSPLDRVNLSRLSPGMFGERGLAPVGYTAFAFALGVAAGALIRRTVPAMAVTLAGLTGARLAVTYGVRPRLLTPLHATGALVLPAASGPAPAPGADAAGPGGWILSDHVINAAGRVIGSNGGIGPNGEIGFATSHGITRLQGVGACPNAFPAVSDRASQPPPAFAAAAQECVSRLGLREAVTYQPLSRYWQPQWYEALIFSAAALALAGLCFWRVHRSLT
ncbi:MAG TPA: ABC transporter permease [Trebonia sp.]|jgi:hypothetical protein|nr:ABC transporter permease [Trebonia sp.]